MRRRADFGNDSQQLGQSLGSTGGLAHLAINFRQLRQSAAREQRVEQELEQPPTCHLAFDDGGRAEPQHADHAGDDQEHGERSQARTRGQPFPGGQKGPFHGPRIPRHHRTLVAERLHGAHRRQILGSVGRSFGKGILRLAGQTPHDTAIGHQRKYDRRDCQQHDSGQLGARHQHHDESADQHDDVAGCLRQRCAGRGLDLCRVGGKPAHDLAGMGPLEECGAEPRQVREHAGADIGDDALA